VPRDVSQTNDFIALFPLELVGVLAAGAVGARVHAPLRVGLYLLSLAAGIATLFPIWLPEDDTILGSAVLAGLLAAVGAGLTFRRWGVPAGTLAFIVVTASGWMSPLARIHTGLLAMLVLIAYLVWRHRPDLSELLWVGVASVLTLAVLILRGPDDWASSSRSVKLYSLPVLLIALGISLRALDQPARSRSATVRGARAASPGGSHPNSGARPRPDGNSGPDFR
jgi:hypothetical protein